MRSTVSISTTESRFHYDYRQTQIPPPLSETSHAVPHDDIKQSVDENWVLGFGGADLVEDEYVVEIYLVRMWSKYVFDYFIQISQV